MKLLEVIFAFVSMFLICGGYFVWYQSKKRNKKNKMIEGVLLSLVGIIYLIYYLT